MAEASAGLALVTGASSGIGFELAKQCASHGFDVIVAAEDAAIHEAARDIASSVTEVDSVQVIPIQADLATRDGVACVYDAVRATGRPLEVLMLNAGVGVAGEFVETSLEEDLRLIELNISSVVHLAKLALPDMVARGSGRVLVTSSVAAAMPGPYYATYAASKAFDLSFAQALRYELKERGVTVTALMPGPTDTNFFDRAGMEDTRAGQGPKDDPADVAADGFRAMMSGDDHIVAGSFRNKVQVTTANVLPDTATAAMHAKLTEPGGAEG